MATKPFRGHYRITQRYGANPRAYADFGMQGHNGVDFALPAHTAVLAPRRMQIVERANDPGGYGLYVTGRDEDRGEWLNAHFERFTVALNQWVEQGQQIGWSDNTGNSTADHLHSAYRPYGYDRNNGYYGWVNPRPYFTDLPPYRVLLQAGHYPNAGGAPGEAAWTHRFVIELAGALGELGIEVEVAGDWFNKPVPAVATRDYDLAYFAHYDASMYGDERHENVGGFTDRGANESEVWEASRFQQLFRDTYFRLTGIAPRYERRNANTWAYYGYAAMSGPTPAVLVEHGCGATAGKWYTVTVDGQQQQRWAPVGGDAATLHDNLPLVVSAVTETFRRYFWIEGPAPPAPEPLDYVLDRSGVFGMNQEDVIEFKLRPLWEGAGQPFDVGFGMVKAVADLYLGGLYFGKPTLNERPLPPKRTAANGDTVGGSWQAFEHGEVNYWDDGHVEWLGGVPVTKKASN